MNRSNPLFPRTISWRIIAVLAVMLLALSLVPILWISLYNVPSADDFSYSNLTRHVWVETHSFLNVIKAALQDTKTTYTTWQGTWAAVFLMTLSPAVFTERLYPLVPVIMLTALLGGLYYFLWALVVQATAEPRSKCVILWVIAGTICLQFMPSASQSLYWYNGSVFYTFFFGLFLLAWGLIINYIHTHNKKGRKAKIIDLILMCILMSLIGGGNYILCLLTGEFWVLLELWLIQGKNKQGKELLFPAIAFFVSFAVSAASPGNAIRQAYFLDRPGLVKSIEMSFSNTLVFTCEKLTVPVLLLLLLLSPVLWSMTENKDWSFRLPGVVTGLSFCLLSSMNTPHIYATGITGPGRYMDIVFFALVLFIIFDLYYWLGWLRRRIKAPENQSKGMELSFVTVLLAVILASVVLLDGAGEKYMTSLSAWHSLRNGEAVAYHEVFLKRLEILQDDSITDAHLPSYDRKPYVLYFDDIYPDANDWPNTSVAQYYDKNSVALDDE